MGDRRRRKSERKERRLDPPPPTRGPVRTHGTGPKYAHVRLEAEKRIKQGRF